MAVAVIGHGKSVSILQGTSINQLDACDSDNPHCDNFSWTCVGCYHNFASNQIESFPILRTPNPDRNIYKEIVT